MKREEKRAALATAGWREKYALKNGNEAKKTENGHTLYIFTFSKCNPYQDANGAIFDATRGAWIN